MLGPQTVFIPHVTTAILDTLPVLNLPLYIARKAASQLHTSNAAAAGTADPCDTPSMGASNRS